MEAFLVSQLAILPLFDRQLIHLACDNYISQTYTRSQTEVFINRFLAEDSGIPYREVAIKVNKDKAKFLTDMGIEHAKTFNTCDKVPLD